MANICPAVLQWYPFLRFFVSGVPAKAGIQNQTNRRPHLFFCPELWCPGSTRRFASHAAGGSGPAFSDLRGPSAPGAGAAEPGRGAAPGAGALRALAHGGPRGEVGRIQAMGPHGACQVGFWGVHSGPAGRSSGFLPRKKLEGMCGCASSQEREPK